MRQLGNELESTRMENAELRIALENHNSGSKQLAKWLEESRLDAMDTKRQAASDRARARMLGVELEAARVELAAAKEELLKCVQWQHELRQQRAVTTNQNRIQLTYLLECHRKNGITPLFLSLEEYVQKLQGETK